MNVNYVDEKVIIIFVRKVVLSEGVIKIGLEYVPAVI